MVKIVENDIYNNKKKYEDFQAKLEEYLEKPEGKRKYQIKNKANLKYFNKLFDKFAARDSSFIRRLRLLRSFLIVCDVLNKDLAQANRDDIDKVMAFFNSQNFSVKTKRDFSLDLKFIWKQILPEKDEKGREDETIVPYVVRHLTGKVDKSREKKRQDRLSVEEFERLVAVFNDDVRIQALLTLTLESLVRPQELLYVKIKDVHLFENYAKIDVSEHGKEGIKFLRCIDSYKYVAEWYNKHPLKHDKNAFFFITLGNKNKYSQLKPYAVNALIRKRCKLINIDKPITCYSLKRNGVTIRRLRGESDVNIQHTAGWTSTKQLKTYDQSAPEESFKIELIKRGLIKADKEYKQFQPLNKECVICGFKNGIGDSVCSNCKRPLGREAIEAEIKKKEEEQKKEILAIAEKVIEEKLKERGAT